MASVLMSLLVHLHAPAGATVPLNGELPDDRFGSSVTDAGDVDGDGFHDLLIGAPGADLDTGRVMLYLGGPLGPSTVPALVLYGDPALSGPYGTAYGATVSKAGDVNADGYDDVAIAAGGPGQVYVHHGSANGLSATPATTFGSWGFLGTTLAEAGDVNGDGYADLLVGAQGDAHYQVSGRAFVHLGSPTGIDPTPVVTWTGGEDFFLGSYDYRLGDRVSGAGDVDGDGFDDVLITAGLADVHLYAGSPTGPDPVATQVWTAGSNVYDVAGADVNGDGYGDVAIAVINPNRIEVFEGSLAGAASSPSSSTRVKRPSSLARAGDVNGDGFEDLVSGAPWVDDEKGEVAILVGSRRGLRPQPWMVVRGGSYDADGYQQGDRLGGSVSTALDVDGDGFDEVVMGGLLADDATGQALVVSGRPDLDVTVTEASVSGGVTVDVANAPLATPFAVVVRQQGTAQGYTIGVGYANGSGEIHVEGALPAGIPDGAAIAVVAVGERTWSGWTTTERSRPVGAVVTP